MSSCSRLGDRRVRTGEHEQETVNTKTQAGASTGPNRIFQRVEAGETCISGLRKRGFEQQNRDSMVAGTPASTSRTRIGRRVRGRNWRSHVSAKARIRIHSVDSQYVPK